EALDLRDLAKVVDEAQRAVDVRRKDPRVGAEGGEGCAVDDLADGAQAGVGDEGAGLREIAGDDLLGLDALEVIQLRRETGQRADDPLIGVRGVLGANKEEDVRPFRGGEEVGRERAAEEAGGAGDEDLGLGRAGFHGDGWFWSGKKSLLFLPQPYQTP